MKSAANFTKTITARVFKRPQISLAALMVLIAVSAVLIQYVVLPAYRRSARKNMLDRITQLKGTWHDLKKEPLQRRLLLKGEKVDDPFMKELAGVVHLIPELTELDLLQTAVSDKSWIELLKRQSQINHYVLFENAITDAAIEQARVDYPQIKIEQRRPDSVAAKLAAAPIPPAAIISLSYDPPTKQLWFGSGDGRLHRLGLNGDQKRMSDKKHGDWVFDVAMSPSREWIATAGGDNRLAVHRRNDGVTLASGMGHTEDVHGVVWLDDTRLVTSGDDKTLRLWELNLDEGDTDSSSEATSKLRLVATTQAHDKQVPRIIKIDNQSILTVSRDHSLRQWRIKPDGFELQQTFAGHADDCMDASVSPNGDEFASVSYDGQLILWDTKLGRPILRRPLGNERLFSVHVDWSKRHAVIGSKSCVQLVDLDTGQLLRKTLDQSFVSKIIRCDDVLLTSDGFGRIFERDPTTLSVRRKFQLYEGRLDVFSSETFQRLSAITVPAEYLAAASLRTR